MNWYCLEVASGREKQIVEDVVPSIFAQAWYPVRTAYRRPPGKPPVPYDVPAVSGYVLVQNQGDVPWHMVRSVKGYIRPVGGINPRVITDAEMKAMAQLPETLMAIAEAAKFMATVRIGDRVAITKGMMAGQFVTVQSIKAGEAVTEIGNARVTVPLENLSKAGVTHPLRTAKHAL